MVIILFRSRLTQAAGVDYSNKNTELEEYVRAQPGFIEAKSFTAADGERLTVVWWQDREMLRIWQEDPRHLDAKKTGRKDWYQYYKMEVAEVFRRSDFDRTELPQSNNSYDIHESSEERHLKEIHE